MAAGRNVSEYVAAGVVRQDGTCQRRVTVDTATGVGEVGRQRAVADLQRSSKVVDCATKSGSISASGS
jgi:hypothetical protein